MRRGEYRRAEDEVLRVPIRGKREDEDVMSTDDGADVATWAAIAPFRPHKTRIAVNSLLWPTTAISMNGGVRAGAIPCDQQACTASISK